MVVLSNLSEATALISTLRSKSTLTSQSVSQASFIPNHWKPYHNAIWKSEKQRQERNIEQCLTQESIQIAKIVPILRLYGAELFNISNVGRESDEPLPTAEITFQDRIQYFVQAYLQPYRDMNDDSTGSIHPNVRWKLLFQRLRLEFPDVGRKVIQVL